MTGTAVDSVVDFSQVVLGGLKPGLVVVYDDGPGYVAVTEFCARLMAAAAARNSVWIDPRYQIGDGGGLIRPVPDLPPELLVVAPRGGVDTHTLLELIDWVFLGPWQVASAPTLCVLDSLPAITDVAFQPEAVEQVLTRAHGYCVDQGSLLVVGNYVVTGEYGLNAVGCNRLNAMAHTQIRVRHEGNRFGVSIPICRHGLPAPTWVWDKAYIHVGE